MRDLKTLMGLSGFGDLILTCSSEQSRNFSYGLSIGRAGEFDADITVEGAHTAVAVSGIAAANGLDLPVAKSVDDLVSGRANVGEVLQTLLSRPPKEE